jgi:hypothetical protein
MSASEKIGDRGGPRVGFMQLLIQFRKTLSWQYKRVSRALYSRELLSYWYTEDNAD